MSEKPLDLEPIKDRLAASTKGPLEGDCAGRIFEPGGLAIGKAYAESDSQLWENAPTDIAALVAEVERLRSRLNEEMGLSLVLSEHLDSRNSEVARLRDGG